jgi:hypothetical protein
MIMFVDGRVERESRRVHKNTLRLGQTVWAASPVGSERSAKTKLKVSARVLRLTKFEVVDILADRLLVKYRHYEELKRGLVEGKMFFSDYNIDPFKNLGGVDYRVFNSYEHAFERVRELAGETLNVFLSVYVSGLEDKCRGEINYWFGIAKTELSPELVFPDGEPMGCIVNPLGCYYGDARGLKTINREEHYSEQVRRFAELGSDNDTVQDCRSENEHD